MHTERRLRSTSVTVAILSFVSLSLLVNTFDPHVHAKSFKSTTSLSAYPTISRDDIIARAKTWVEAHVPYDEYGWYPGYREDCSGYVSMAWQLLESLTTYTLPTVSHQVNKDDLLPGDILLNQWGGWTKYGSPDAHVVIFDSRVDSSHTHYNAYEESPYYGEANYTTNIPYPYWPGYDSSEYVPMRLNNLSNPPASTSTSITTPSIPVPIPTPTQPLKLEINPSSFDASVCPNWKCKMTLSSPSSNTLNIDWKATITLRAGLGTTQIGSISPAGGTLAPGQEITVFLIISSWACGDITGSTITFTGGASPVVVQLSGSFGPC